jgi:hypothetical protein
MQTITTEEKLRRILQFLKALHLSIMKGSVFNTTLMYQRCKLDKLNWRMIPILLNEGLIEATGSARYRWTKRKDRMFPGGKHFTEGMPKYLLDIIEKAAEPKQPEIKPLVTVNKEMGVTIAPDLKILPMQQLADSFKGKLSTRTLQLPPKVENITDAERVALHKILDHVIMVDYPNSVPFDDLTIMVAKQIKEKL